MSRKVYRKVSAMDGYLLVVGAIFCFIGPVLICVGLVTLGRSLTRFSGHGGVVDHAAVTAVV